MSSVFLLGSLGLLTNRHELSNHYAAGAAGAAGAGAAGAGAAGAAAGAGAGGTAAPLLIVPASTVVPQELQPAAGAETVTVTAAPQPQLGAGAGAAQPQLGAGAASQPQLGAGAASQPHVGAGAGQHVGAGAGSQQEGAPLHLLAILALILAINPPPWQDACFLACNLAKMPCRPQQLVSPPQPAIANELLRANATANASEANRTLII